MSIITLLRQVRRYLETFGTNNRYFPFFLSRNGSRIIHSVDAGVSRMRICLRKVAIASMRGRA